MKIIKNILFSIYLGIALIITLLLLFYNQFKVTEVGTYSLVLVEDSEFAPQFNKGDLVIVNKDDTITTGENAFFYDTYNQKIEVKLAVVEVAEKVTETETTYTMEGDRKISGEYVLGAANSAQVIPNLGTVLSILESKWGFLFFIVFPILIVSVNQIGVVFSNILQVRKEEKQETETKEKDKE